ncbi:MAG: alkaline phosphatase D family protein [Melioribacteraceae bacterium]|nr:alkaline phosphatase D family protein [Melioribacteraceae bacterium]
MLRKLNLLSLIIILTTGCSDTSHQADFISSFSNDVTRTWIGPDYWSNPLQDWQLNDGRIECIVSGGDRNVVLLTREIMGEEGSFQLSVEFGKLDGEQQLIEPGWIGFKIGIRGEFLDYRDSAVRGEGFPAGITTDGRLFIGRIDSSKSQINSSLDYGKLILSGNVKNDQLTLSLTLSDEENKIISRLSNNDYDPDWIKGMIAIVSHSGKLLEKINGRRNLEYPVWGSKPGTGRQGNMRFWFKNLHLGGNLVNKFSDRSYGPLLFSQYSLSSNILKLTVQLPPIGGNDGNSVEFQIEENGSWTSISTEPIDPLSRTATFKIENWDSQRDVPYRLVYELRYHEDEYVNYYREGVIRKEPLHKDEIVVAGFTGNNDLGFPNNELVNAVKYHDPDVLFFSGDQIYEGIGGYGTLTNSLEKISLDYLRKWYLFGWTYGDLMKDRPSVSIPDDHDVYHGNIWGAGGKATPEGLVGSEAQDMGGYKYFPEWVNMVQRTQTSHLPDPFDPEPVMQNIGVYYCNMNYGGVSFAILEDRKFKSAPKILLPNANVNNGWAQNKSFNAKTSGDVEGAVLLGERQLGFLENWAADWSNNTWMKVVLSQTIFANVATLPEEHSNSDRIVPQLKIFDENEYPPDDIPVQDMDSNGWPQTPRNKALEIIRKAFAIHIAGDQHLGSMIQYGINEWNDAAYAFCVPAVSNVWPRRWLPQNEGKNRKSGMPKYSGEFEDGFGNLITVHAVSNPFYSGKKPSKLYDRATGYGIIRLARTTRDVTFECWPRWVDPSDTNAEQYPGWPVKINQDDNFASRQTEFLPRLIVNNYDGPIVQVIDESNNEIVYTKRILGKSFDPPLIKRGTYTIRVGELGTHKEKVFKNINSQSRVTSNIEVNL